MKNLTPELIREAKTAKSAEELLALAKANNVELTAEEAKTYFEQLNATDAVADDELDVVAGSGSCPGENDPCPRCGASTVPAANAKRKCLKCGYKT